MSISDKPMEEYSPTIGNDSDNQQGESPEDFNTILTNFEADVGLESTAKQGHLGLVKFVGERMEKYKNLEEISIQGNNHFAPQSAEVDQQTEIQFTPQDPQRPQRPQRPQTGIQFTPQDPPRITRIPMSEEEFITYDNGSPATITQGGEDQSLDIHVSETDYRDMQEQGPSTVIQDKIQEIQDTIRTSLNSEKGKATKHTEKKEDRFNQGRRSQELSEDHPRRGSTRAEVNEIERLTRKLRRLEEAHDRGEYYHHDRPWYDPKRRQHDIHRARGEPYQGWENPWNRRNEYERYPPPRRYMGDRFGREASNQRDMRRSDLIAPRSRAHERDLERSIAQTENTTNQDHKRYRDTSVTRAIRRGRSIAPTEDATTQEHKRYRDKSASRDIRRSRSIAPTGNTTNQYHRRDRDTSATSDRRRSRSIAPERKSTTTTTNATHESLNRTQETVTIDESPERARRGSVSESRTQSDDKESDTDSIEIMDTTSTEINARGNREKQDRRVVELPVSHYQAGTSNSTVHEAVGMCNKCPFQGCDFTSMDDSNVDTHLWEAHRYTKRKRNYNQNRIMTTTECMDITNQCQKEIKCITSVMPEQWCFDCTRNSDSLRQQYIHFSDYNGDKGRPEDIPFTVKEGFVDQGNRSVMSSTEIKKAKHYKRTEERYNNQSDPKFAYLRAQNNEIDYIFEDYNEMQDSEYMKKYFGYLSPTFTKIESNNYRCGCNQKSPVGTVKQVLSHNIRNHTHINKKEVLCVLCLLSDKEERFLNPSLLSRHIVNTHERTFFVGHMKPNMDHNHSFKNDCDPFLMGYTQMVASYTIGALQKKGMLNETFYNPRAGVQKIWP